MPTKTGKPYSGFYGNDLAVDQAGNTGVDATVRKIQDGFGNDSSLSLSKRQTKIYCSTHNTTTAFTVADSANANILAIDTSNSKVLVGASQVAANTLIKEMGLYEFSPNAAGYHYPLKANTMFSDAESLTYEDDWGNSADPPTTLDISGLTDPENAIAVYWYVDHNITLDSVRYMAIADGTATLNFHLFAYTLDTSSNHGDLSSGTVHANASVAATATTIKTGTFTLDEADIDQNKVVIGFVENHTDTSDLSCSFQINYHIR